MKQNSVLDVNLDRKAVIVPNDKETRLSSLYWVLWMIFRNMEPKVSSRMILDEMSIAFSNAYYDGIRFQFKNRLAWEYPHLDSTFGEAEAFVRWFSMFRECKGDGVTPARMSNKPERIRIIYSYIVILHPHLAKHLKF